MRKSLRPWRILSILSLWIIGGCGTEATTNHVQIELVFSGQKQLVSITNTGKLAIEWDSGCCETPPHGYEIEISTGWTDSSCGVPEMGSVKGCCGLVARKRLEPGEKIIEGRESLPQDCKDWPIRALLRYYVAGDSKEYIARSPSVRLN
ncbi:MAG: hypothetical protein H6728_17760 [Myxococcales bacterium]|nr:hypothetical protein [Myxococcales bacterium]MCB9644922.1 hypothetical protein [Myxococcales bacterium]